MIPFNKPYTTGKELEFISSVFSSNHFSGNGSFTKKSQKWFEEKYSFEKCILTTSCTDALEMAAILIDIKPGDEVIMPSYTFVSTANAFVLRGAKIIFIDSHEHNPNLNVDLIEEHINNRTKAVVAVHYAGFACEMERLVEICQKQNIRLIEDAAQAIDNYYISKDGNKIPLGSFGDLSTFSFHETKNIHCGEGGLLVINDKNLIKRAEIIWEKGTNRSAFFRGEVDKYGWVDIGSSFLPSELNSAFLYAQLTCLEEIQNKRLQIWQKFHLNLKDWAINNNIRQPDVPFWSLNNAHLYYLLMPNEESRDRLILYMKNHGVQLVFHYQSLHKSLFYKTLHDGRELPNADKFSKSLVRLPLFPEVDGSKVIDLLTKYN